MWGIIGLNLLMWMVQQSPSTAAALNDAGTRFEIASVKISPEGAPFRNIGGPNTASPGQWRCTSGMQWLIAKAWKLSHFQLAPNSALPRDAYDIEAIVPSGTSPDVFRLMLQDLLKSRFGLVVHFEKKMMTTYELTVAISGSKMKDAEPAHGNTATGQPSLGGNSGPEPARFEIGSDGRSQLIPGKPMMVMSGLGGVNRLMARMQSMSDLARFFEGRLGSPVKDKTGMTGLYDFVLEFAKDGLGGGMIPASGETVQASTPSPDLFAAVRKQLGLKLESAKEPIDILIIDHLNRTPTGN